MPPHFSDKKHVQTVVSLEVHRALSISALDAGISLSDLVGGILNNWVKKEKEKNNGQKDD